jgi:rfaE bifunctional protein nucleotidyltransferase chain/domain
MKIVINGTFDVMHRGHIELLKAAKNYLGYTDNTLLVLIDTDERVKQLKGTDRPINNQADRKALLEAIRYVDRVEMFNSDEELINWLKIYSPDVMYKGSDWRGKPIVGEAFCQSIYFYDRIEPYSSTKTIQDITTR